MTDCALSSGTLQKPDVRDDLVWTKLRAAAAPRRSFAHVEKDRMRGNPTQF